MEKTDEVVNEEVKNNEELGNVETTETEKNVGDKAEEKLFTQEQLDEIVKTRIAKERKKLPSKQELDEYHSWKDSQKTAEEKQAELQAEYQKKDEKISSLEKENMVLRCGVKDEDDIDYIIYKVSKMEGEFEDNLSSFLKQHPKFTSREEVEHKATGIPVKQMNSTENDGVLAILKAKHPEINI